MNKIRNFSIIAHINHGKSTLSDRIIQICGGLSDREMEAQVLDSMELERERGITIKAQNVTLNYKSLNGETYQLNLIDTPGHIDFHYEVSRSLAACEGALLVIDIGQGVEAQTLTTYYTAIEMDLKIIPVLNKIDLLSVDLEHVMKKIGNILNIDVADFILCSAKTGVGVTNVLEKLIRDVPPPKGDPNLPLQALIIDSWFNNYLGVVSLVCVKNGSLHKGKKIKVINTDRVYNVDCLGIFTPKKVNRTELKCGEVGWIVCSIKDILSVPVGATLTDANNPSDQVLPKFKKVKAQVYASLFPTDSNDYEIFRDALKKLGLNDASLTYKPENSVSLGFGFRCGFLGLLHMEIIQERLKREYGLDLIVTTPTVVYEVELTNKKIIYIDSPSKLPAFKSIKELREPIVECHMLLPQEYLGDVMALCIEKRGIQTKIVYHDEQVSLTYDIPMAEVIFDFFDRLKSISRGYSSLEYNFKCFQLSDIVRVDIMINKDFVDALSFFIHKNSAIYHCRKLVEKIKDLIPRKQFDIKIQALINGRIITHAIVKQLRKNVIEKCYGGDVSRKKKLLQKQKKGKKRMKKIGNIELPKEAFFTVLQINKNYR